jgi:two-component system sensor histidine kinase TctE
MLAPLLLLWPMSVALTWLVAQSIANRPYDRELGELARAVAARWPAPVGARARPCASVRSEMDHAATSLLRPTTTTRVFFQVLGVRGEFVAGDFDLPVPLTRRAPRRSALSRRRGA